jgi:N-dimethylarginine dimethylaminohydrolase|tara:strand:- start:23 stop:1003 length:981 start_codon:yes stop_codon:yes gene_type:complete
MNEWGKVKKVIVGTATGARYLPDDIGVRQVDYAERGMNVPIPKGAYDQDIIDEANEDLDNFAKIYTDFGAEVVRPRTGFVDHYLYCPRDNILTIDDKIIASPMSMNCRKTEWQYMCEVTHDLTNSTFTEKDYNNDCIMNKRILATNNYQPMWDAANILRAGRDILYLLSNTGNQAGAEQLQRLLGPNFTVHILQDVYSFSHIDTTIALLKPGTALINPSRIKSKDQLPVAMQNWDLIECPEPIDMPFHGLEAIMSQWTGMNCVSLDEKTVIVQSTQTNLIKILEQKGFTVIPLYMKHQRSLSGGPHCCTVELARDYELEYYFDNKY